MSDRVTRKPTGKPPWPILLLAGMEKAGKSYAAAVASSADVVGRTFWVGVGEDDPDEYGAIPGARFEIVEHDGTYRDILAALTWAKDQPAEGKPNLIVFDSGTRGWDLLCGMAQHEANEQAAKNARKYNRPVSAEDQQITMNLWNTAADRWGHWIDTLREHSGPSIITARMEETVVVENEKPTKDRTWKVKAHKSLPYDVGAIVEMRSRSEVLLTGVRSLRYKDAGQATKYPGQFSVVDLWDKLGLLGEDATSPRQHASIDPADKPHAEADAARAELLALCEQNGWPPADVAAAFVEGSGGIKLTEATAGEVRDYMEHLTAERAA